MSPCIIYPIHPQIHFPSIKEYPNNQNVHLYMLTNMHVQHRANDIRSVHEYVI